MSFTTLEPFSASVLVVNSITITVTGKNRCLSHSKWGYANAFDLKWNREVPFLCGMLFLFYLLSASNLAFKAVAKSSLV
jgi:hypothetical protein